MDGDALVRVEYEGSSQIYALYVVTHERLGTKVRIAQHFVAATPAQHEDHVGVNLGTKEGHGARGAE